MNVQILFGSLAEGNLRYDTIAKIVLVPNISTHYNVEPSELLQAKRKNVANNRSELSQSYQQTNLIVIGVIFFWAKDICANFRIIQDNK